MNPENQVSKTKTNKPQHDFNIQAADDPPCEGGNNKLAVLINLVSDSKTHAGPPARC